MTDHAQARPRLPAAALVVVAALAAQIATMLPVFLLGTMFPLIAREVGLSLSSLGQAAATFFAASACGSLLLASASDRLGPWTVARSALAITAALCLVLPLTGGIAPLAAAMAVAGLANGAIQPATNVALSQHVPSGRQGLAFGMKQASVPLASLLAGLAVPLVALWFGWRAAFYGAALLPVVLIAVLPSGRGRPAAPPGGGARPAWSTGTLLALGGMSGLGAGSANAMAAYLVTATEGAGFALADAGLLVSLGSAVSIAARIALGWAADRWHPPLLACVTALMAGGALAYALLAGSGSWGLMVLATCLAFGMGWGWAGLSILAIVRANPGATGRATGMVQAGLFGGAVAGPLLFGHLAAHGGFALAWTALAAAASVAVAIAAVLALRLERRE